MTAETLPLEALLTACDREPIHVPGAIQPHGMLIAWDPERREIAAAAGALPGLEPDRASLEALLERPLSEIEALAEAPSLVCSRSLGDLRVDITAHRSGTYLVFEVEPATSTLTAARALGQAQELAARLDAALSVVELCRNAAEAVHALTGYGRIMIYRFLADDSGAVIAEARDPGVSSLLNHRFPESDIPRQARALYARNPVRVIPDSAYVPAPLRWTRAGDDARLDMSDCNLRSVSPIHLQYLRNMDVAASASISIMVGGKLWGLIACHHHEPRGLDFVEREMAKHIGQLVGAQIAARQRLATQMERARLAQLGEELAQIIQPAIGSVEETLLRHASDVARAIPSDGVVVSLGERSEQSGSTPSREQLRELLPRFEAAAVDAVFSSHHLSAEFPEAAGFAAAASGILHLRVRHDPRLAITWFRAEQVETIGWAGNPHKTVRGPAGMLTPRKSFDLWSETVRGQARPWSPGEIDAARRVGAALSDMLDQQELRNLNRQLRRALGDKEQLIAHKDLLMREVHHRVQNSLQLVNSMLYLQQRESGNDDVRMQFELARQRLTAVAMVHRRLWRTDKLGDVRLDTFMAELVDELASVWDSEWRAGIDLEVEPVTLPTDQSILLGLIVTELMTNAVKYAYDGKPGPILIEGSREGPDRVRLSIADRGSGLDSAAERRSFGSRLVETLIGQLEGKLERRDNRPGLRVELNFPVAPHQG